MTKHPFQTSLPMSHPHSLSIKEAIAMILESYSNICNEEVPLGRSSKLNALAVFRALLINEMDASSVSDNTVHKRVAQFNTHISWWISLLFCILCPMLNRTIDIGTQRLYLSCDSAERPDWTQAKELHWAYGKTPGSTHPAICP